MQINWARIKDTVVVVVVLLLLVATACFAKDSLGVLLPLLTAVVSGSFAYYFSKKKELELRISEEKRTRYEKLILHVKEGFFNPNLTEEEKTQHKEEYYQQSYVVWLYASDDVVRNLNAFALAVSALSEERSDEQMKVVRQALE